MKQCRKVGMMVALAGLWVVVGGVGWAAEDDNAMVLDVDKPPLLSELPREAFKAGENQFLTLNVENDMFGGGTDRHYTNGVRLSYFDMRYKPPAFTQLVDDWLPMFTVNERTAVVYSVGQNMYVPDDITLATQQPGQRPWAGWLYGSVGLATLTDRHVDELELTLGMVGPASLAEPTQKAIHRWVGADRPQGWDNQLHNEPGLIVGWQRRWPSWRAWENDDWRLAVEPSVGLTGGNVYAYGATGMNVKFGPLSSRFQDTPVRVQPAMPGTGFYAPLPDNQWATWFVFAGVNGRAVARNIFLDGNTFDGESPSVDKEILVADLNAGVAVTLGRVRLSYATIYRTAEYVGQDSNDLFGTFNVGYRF